MVSSKKTIFWIFLLVVISGCLGKTVPRQDYFISSKKKTVFIAPPVNYTDQFLLDDRVRTRIEEVFSSRTRFGVVDMAEDSDLYVLLYLYDYQSEEVGNYGFGNRVITIKTGLFVSDSRYRDRPRDEEQAGRYYYKDLPLTVDVIDYVSEGDSYLTETRMENLIIEKLAVAVHELMLSGKLPDPNRIDQ